MWNYGQDFEMQNKCCHMEKPVCKETCMKKEVKCCEKTCKCESNMSQKNGSCWM